MIAGTDAGGCPPFCAVRRAGGHGAEFHQRIALTANSNMSKPVTIRKLALAANVSIGTVSRALKGSPACRSRRVARS